MFKATRGIRCSNCDRSKVMVGSSDAEDEDDDEEDTMARRWRQRSCWVGWKLVVLALCTAVDAAARNTAATEVKDVIALVMRRKRSRGEAPVTMPTRKWNSLVSASCSLSGRIVI
jgi:hypothetical protein